MFASMNTGSTRRDASAIDLEQRWSCHICKKIWNFFWNNASTIITVVKYTGLAANDQITVAHAAMVGAQRVLKADRGGLPYCTGNVCHYAP